MSKIVALKDTADLPGVRITMDISKERVITVDHQGKNYWSKECQDGLYYYDNTVYNPISGTTNKSNYTITPYSFIITIEDNKSYFSSNEIEGANNARKLQHIIE